MPSEPKRKLAAIMFTDMVGYTSLMQKDESKARELIQRHRDLMKPLIKKHSGTVLQYVGDGTFCTFDSAIEAVNCGFEIQYVLKVDKELSLRIGIHIGDVVSDGDEVYGDGVNVASRLEPMAEPGGICVSQEVYRQVKSHPDISARSLGKTELKNVEDDMEVYALSKTEEPVGATEEEEVVTEKVSSEKKSSKSNMTKYASIAAAILLVWLALKYIPGDGGVQETVSDENSVAVLFIENISDPDDPQNLTRMIRELLITDLSQTQSLRVIGSQRLYDIAKKYKRNGSKPITRENATEIAREARARWILTGSLSKFGDKLLLTTQIEGVSDGKVLNAQRSEGEDLFAVIDALGDQIRTHLGVSTAASAEASIPIADVTTDSKEAYRLYIEGLEKFYEFENMEAEELLSRAVEIDSTFSQALFYLGQAQVWNESLPPYLRTKRTFARLKRHPGALTRAELMLIEGMGIYLNQEYEKSEEIFKEILKENKDYKQAHYQLGEAYFHNGDRDNLLALREFEITVELDPEFTTPYFHIFQIYRNEDMDDEGIKLAKEFVDEHPDNSLGYDALGNFYASKYYDGYDDPDEALKYFEKSSALAPDGMTYLRTLAFFNSIIGNFKKSEEQFRKIHQNSEEVLDIIVAKIGLAVNNYELGDRRKAFEYLKEIDEYEDAGLVRYLGKLIEGQFLIYEGKINSGLRAFEDALAIAEENGGRRDVLYDLLSALHHFGRYELSNKATDLIFKYKGSTEDEVWVNLIKLRNYAAIGEIVKAEKELRKAKELVSNSSRRLQNEKEIKRGAAQIAFAKGDYEAANRELFRSKPTENLHLKSQIYIASGDYNKALESADRLGKYYLNNRFIDYPFSLYYKGQIYQKMGNATEARKNYEALIELWKDGDKDNPILVDTIKRLDSLKKGS